MTYIGQRQRRDIKSCVRQRRCRRFCDLDWITRAGKLIVKQASDLRDVVIKVGRTVKVFIPKITQTELVDNSYVKEHVSQSSLPS